MPVTTTDDTPNHCNGSKNNEKLMIILDGKHLFLVILFLFSVICTYILSDVNRTHPLQTSLKSWINNNQLSYHIFNSNITNNITFNNTNISKILTCELWIRPRYPNIEMHSFFHDSECMIASLNQIPHSISDCTELYAFIPQKHGDIGAYRYLFKNVTQINNKEFYANPKVRQNNCKRTPRWFRNKNNRLTQFQQYIIKKFKFYNKYNIPYNLTFYENYGDILIIDRHHHRGIANVKQLYNTLISIYGINRVQLVYFEDINIIKQYQYIVNSSVIITPHGAAEASFIMVNNNKHIKEQIKLIELCMPYSHCGWYISLNRRHRANLCPYYFDRYYKNHKIIGIGREDIHWNCAEYCKYQEQMYTNRNWGAEFRRINNFTVDVNLVVQAINNFTLSEHILVSKVNMTGKEFYFFNATSRVTQGYFDLDTTPKE